MKAEVDIVDSGLVANFSIDQNVASMPPVLYDRLVYQANTLNLSERFGEEISGVLVSHIVHLHLMFREGAQMVRSFCLRKRMWKDRPIIEIIGVRFSFKRSPIMLPSVMEGLPPCCRWIPSYFRT